ncbi:hypothetical protein [Streptomyces pseudogriseolus]|uniref:hypothetical protein n=1 Tax=Streptomyces pseudogriseolus TaxID=36817 RepID=UPI003FA2062C
MPRVDAPEGTPVDAPEGTPVDAPEESPENSYEGDDEGDDEDDEGDDEDLLAARARRARWAAVGTGAVLALAGTAAAVLRAAGTAPVLVPVAYACGAAVCALAAVMGSRARTRRALWTTVAGVMVMALGDQFD